MQKYYTWAAETHQGHHRDHNEDRYAVFSTPIGEVFMVCDGMGGHAAGDVAATLATQQAKSLLEHASPHYDPPYWLRRALHYAHQGILEYAQGQYGASGMGTTAVLLLLDPKGNAWWAHTGDSRLYLLREGRLYPLTHDHSYVSLLVDTGHLSPEAAFGHPQSHQLLFTLGSGQGFTVVDSSSFPLQVRPGDRFLLCSDGLSGLVPDSTLAQLLAQSKPLPDIVRALIQAALDAGGYDNITAIAVEIGPIAASSLSASPSPWRKRLILALGGLVLFLLGMLSGGLFLEPIRLQARSETPQDTTKVPSRTSTPGDTLRPRPDSAANASGPDSTPTQLPAARKGSSTSAP